MQQSVGNRQVLGPAIIGVLLIAVGAGALAMREFGTNILPSIGVWGWPLFIIVPGVLLLGLSLVPAPPRGIGLATAGAIVTTVGLLLLYQWRTGHWESWAYAWTLIPLGTGVAMALYGLFARARNLVTSGLWMAAIAALLFGAGAWFFEGLFAGEDRLVDAGNWWPVAVVALGAILIVRAIINPGRVEPAAAAAAAPARPAPPATGGISPVSTTDASQASEPTGPDRIATI